MASSFRGGRRAFPKTSLTMIILVAFLVVGMGNIPKPSTDDDLDDNPEPTSCDDGIDNDLDGLTDLFDPECDILNSAYDGNETGDA